MKNPSVSIAKSVAIILMVMAHARCGIWWQHYINMFHMPLFLFMSGYCFKEAHLTDAKGFVEKRVRGLWWPFVKWQLAFLLLHNVFFALNIYNGEYGFRGEVSHEYGLMETVKNAFYIVTTMSHGEQLLGGFWFLKSLFVGSLLFYFATKTAYHMGGRENLFSDISVGCVLLFATLIFGFVDKNIPFIGIGAREFMAGFFVWCGFTYNKFGYVFEKYWRFIIIAVLIVAVGTEFWQCSMMHLKGNFRLIMPYVFTGILGSLMVYGLSERLASYNNWLKRFLEYVGDKTLYILTWHFLSFKLVSLLLIWRYELPVESLAEFPVIEEYACQGWWVIYLIVGTGIPLGVVFILDKIANNLTPPSVRKRSEALSI